MFSLPRYSLLFLAIIFLSANLAKATVTWTQVDYPGATNTDVRGINNKGDAVGSYRDTSGVHGFLLSNGAFTTIDYPGAYSTQAESINDAGVIAGTYELFLSPTEPTGFIYQNGVMTTFQVPGRNYTWIHGINNAGDIVGESQKNTGTVGYIHHSDGTFANIIPKGAASTLVKGINNSGDIVGYYFVGYDARGFVFRNGTYQLIDFPKSQGMELNAVNDLKQLAGEVQFNFAPRGFARFDDEVLILPHVWTDWVWVLGMNNNADMVGYFYDTLTGSFHGFIRTR